MMDNFPMLILAAPLFAHMPCGLDIAGRCTVVICGVSSFALYVYLCWGIHRSGERDWNLRWSGYIMCLVICAIVFAVTFLPVFIVAFYVVAMLSRY
jgi:hypothetical protein